MKRTIATMISIATIVAGPTACSSTTPGVSGSAQVNQNVTNSATGMSPPVFTMSGAFDIPTSGKEKIAQDAACKGTDTYSDIAAGAPVRVYNGAGAVIAQGKLPNGIFKSTPIGSACVFSISVSAVPDGLLQYGVQIGNHSVHPVKSDEMHSWVFLFAD